MVASILTRRPDTGTGSLSMFRSAPPESGASLVSACLAAIPRAPLRRRHRCRRHPGRRLPRHHRLRPGDPGPPGRRHGAGGSGHPGRQREGAPGPVPVDSQRQRRHPGARPHRLQGLDRLREGQAGRCRVHHHPADLHHQRRHRLQPDRGLAGRRRQPRRHGGRAPGLGDGGPRHQRQRLRLGGHPGDRAGRLPGRAAADEAPAVRLVGGGGAGHDRLQVLRHQPAHRRAGEDRRVHELRHDRLAEPGLLRLRRRPQARGRAEDLLLRRRRPDRDRDQR